jgi:hypothetical protein
MSFNSQKMSVQANEMRHAILTGFRLFFFAEPLCFRFVFRLPLEYDTQCLIRS